MIHKIASALHMGSVEGGAMPGESLTAVQTFLYFVAAPVGMFLLITVLVLAGTREKKKTEPGKKPSSVIDSIE
jgi:multisubunit Na+/H+ antiporter MnhG subunit